MSAPWRRIGAALLLAGSHAAIAAGAELPDLRPRAPIELTRSLQALQDQIAIGNHAALTAQSAMHLHIAEQFRAADREVWREPANARAAIVYVLSGGRPQFLRELVDEESLPENMMELAQGAIAYAAGRRQQAWRHFREIDARELAPSLGASVALVQASLTIDNDPEAAIAYLETARLLAPGTLVEEAALRRQLSVASTQSDAESFVFLARQYFRRFARSVYSANLYRALPELWARLGLPAGEETLGMLEATLAELDVEDRRDLYLWFARSRVIAGDLEVAAFAAARAAELSDQGSAESVQAAFYQAAARVAGLEPAEGSRALRAIDPASLSHADAELHAAALAIADLVQQEAAHGVPQDIEVENLEVAAMLERARDSIAAADALLDRSK